MLQDWLLWGMPMYALMGVFVGHSVGRRRRNNAMDARNEKLTMTIAHFKFAAEFERDNAAISGSISHEWRKRYNAVVGIADAARSTAHEYQQVAMSIGRKLRTCRTELHSARIEAQAAVALLEAMVPTTHELRMECIDAMQDRDRYYEALMDAQNVIATQERELERLRDQSWAQAKEIERLKTPTLWGFPVFGR